MKINSKLPNIRLINNSLSTQQGNITRDDLDVNVSLTQDESHGEQPGERTNKCVSDHLVLTSANQNQ